MGSIPHSMGLRVKPPKEQAFDNFILLHRDREKELQEYKNFVKIYNQYCRIHTWQQRNSKRWLHSAVHRRVDAAMQEHQAGIEERRERLHELLEGEKSQYFAEMESLEGTELDRQEKMRERAKLLREKRETARQQLVAEKLEQQFREPCGELHEKWMKKHQQEVCKDPANSMIL
ncbi:cilia- and flagella-associated protein 53-like [Heliangelus exortis]|uniref:cilia- and flagella-associated protein 53-like n=1 Tax=Heliangelus exortis TaxID=472823 RepID=UPI003A945A25